MRARLCEVFQRIDPPRLSPIIGLRVNDGFRRQRRAPIGSGAVRRESCDLPDFSAYLDSTSDRRPAETRRVGSRRTSVGFVMLPEVDKIDFAPIEIPKVRNGPWVYVKIFAALAWLAGWSGPGWRAIGRRCCLQRRNPRSSSWKSIEATWMFTVVETGSIESANNTTIRSQVEALLGTVGGTQGTTAGKSGTAVGRGAGQAVAGGAGGAGRFRASRRCGDRTSSKTRQGQDVQVKAGSINLHQAAGTTAGSSSIELVTARRAHPAHPSTSGSVIRVEFRWWPRRARPVVDGATTTSSKPVFGVSPTSSLPHVPLRPT